MIAADDAALRCDFLEFYHILDYRTLPARRAAVFACGLPERSRIVRKLSGAAASPDTILLAVIADALRVLVWQNTRAGAEGRNPPKSILEALSGPKPSGGFDSAEEFLAWRESMLGGDNDA